MIHKPLYRSFAGGEVTPELYGRIDLTKWQTGLAKCLNFTVLPHGPAARRPGFAFANEAKDSTRRVRILPFQFNSTQTVVLEFGHQYIRFHINGQTLLEANQTIGSIVGNTINLVAHGYSAGEWVYAGSRFLKVATAVADSFTVTDLWGTAVTPTGTTVARVYTISSPYDEADLFALRFSQDSDVLTIAHPSYACRDLRRLGATNWTLTAISFTPPAAPVSAPTVAVTQPAGTNLEPTEYCYTYLDSDGVTESLQSPAVTANNALTLQGNYNTISLTAVVGAQRYYIYKKLGGTFGYIGSTTGLSIIDNNIRPDTTRTPPESTYTLNSGAGEYPTAITYHEQRRWFAGTTNKPQTIWATRTGAVSNITSSLSVQEDDAMEFRIGARQQNAIQHLLPLSDLMALTVGSEFRVFAESSPAITPSSLSIKPQGYTGASSVQPAMAASAILYVQNQGSRMRELSFDWQRQAFASIDISIMAPHLFNGYTIVDQAFARAPVPSLWCVRSDGTLLGLTYVPDQQVYAWHQHTTDGTFESVTVVSEGDEDVVYAVIKRTVNGRDARYIERLHSRTFVDQEDAFFVDSGLTYDGTPVTTLSGLYHLEGREVQILADGAVHPLRTVTGGSITLDYEASVVHVGLAYTSDIVTLPLAFEQAMAAGQGVTKNVNGIAVRVTQSSLVKAGPTFDDLVSYPARDVTDLYGSPPALRTGELRFDIAPDWNSDGNICLRQDEPLPLTVLSMALDVAGGG